MPAPLEQNKTHLLELGQQLIHTKLNKRPQTGWKPIGIIDDQEYMIKPLEILLRIRGYEPVFWQFDPKTRKNQIVIPECIRETSMVLVDHDIANGCRCKDSILHDPCCLMPTGRDIVAILRRTGYRGKIGSISMQIPECFNNYPETIPQFPGKLALYHMPNRELVEEFYNFLLLVPEACAC
ncbi:MAG: hypothetical protein RIQ54_4 [Candidatus Parcubacteria bacterium]